MKTLVGLIGISLLLVAPMANATELWYSRASAKMERVEMDATTGVIILMVSGEVSATVTADDESTCVASAILITPPTGKENVWLAMVLAATMSGNAVSVYGTCNASAYTIEASRMLVDY
jgi:hypothetical protein